MIAKDDRTSTTWIYMSQWFTEDSSQYSSNPIVHQFCLQKNEDQPNSIWKSGYKFSYKSNCNLVFRKLPERQMHQCYTLFQYGQFDVYIPQHFEASQNLWPARKKRINTSQLSNWQPHQPQTRRWYAKQFLYGRKLKDKINNIHGKAQNFHSI